ncbi:MAG TPA: LPS export ABC transporter periplasmic protein LptC [Candidatus Baltobacteraceae bacterium]|jgi:lipopolysaccharide assembly outer membrane protein LptD (OstA)
MKLITSAALVAALMLAGSVATATTGSKSAGLAFGDWNFTSDSLDITNWNAGTFNAPTHVHLDRPGSTVDADRAAGNFKQKDATFYGHVVLHDQNGILTSVAGGQRSPQPATLLCDELQVDGASKIYTATGSVHVTQGASSLQADRAVLDQFTHQLHLSGHVRLIQ